MVYKLSDIVKDAYVRSAVLAEGQTPNAAQMARGVQYLIDLYNGFAANGVLATLKDVYQTTNYTANEGERVFANPGTITITIPATVTDKFTGDVRAPRDGSVIGVANLTSGPQFWVYDAPTATWENLYGLASGSPAPMSFSYHKDITDLLAVQLASKSGVPIDAELQNASVMARMHLTKRNSDRTQVQRVKYF